MRVVKKKFFDSIFNTFDIAMCKTPWDTVRLG